MASKTRYKIYGGLVVALSLTLILLSGCGDGALKRQFTVAGIYTVCKPGGYPVVCFADADSKEGGLFCMPLAEVGGKCL